MTDRQLLELAAKAYGVALNQFPDEDFLRADHKQQGISWNPRWNPLESDADAMRLAVKLGLTVESNANDGDCAAYLRGRVRAAAVEWGGMDPDNRLAATRRAIVRTAAEIGKTVSAKQV